MYMDHTKCSRNYNYEHLKLNDLYPMGILCNGSIVEILVMQ